MLIMLLNTKHSRFKNSFLLALFGVFMAQTVSAANIESRIFSFQQKVAKTGNAKAQFKLAYMYEIGRGTKKDINKAKQWYKKAAVKNFKAANHRLIFIDVKTAGFKSQHKSWLKSLIEESKKGDDNLQFLLANMHEKGIGVKRNLKQAHHYYKASTAKGNADAESKLFRIVQKINMDNADNQRRKEERLAAKKAEAKKQQAKKDAEAKKQKARQLAAERDRKRRDAERKKRAAEKRKLTQQKNMLAKKQAEAKKAKLAADKPKAIAIVEKQEEGFESDLCSGAAARFRTQCN